MKDKTAKRLKWADLIILGALVLLGIQESPHKFPYDLPKTTVVRDGKEVGLKVYRNQFVMKKSLPDEAADSPGVGWVPEEAESPTTIAQ